MSVKISIAKICSVLILIITMSLSHHLYGQCGDVQTFTMTADQSMADLEIDRNAYWSGAPPGEMPSETYEITFPSLEEQFPCLEGVPLLEVVINVTINDVRFRGNNCCQDFFEGIYANLYENCTGFRCGVNGDGLNDSGNPITGTCPAGGMHASYNPDNGRFDIGNFPFRSTTNCLQIQTSDRIGVDIVPSFFYGDASANGCNCSQRLVSDRLVEVSYNIEVTFVVCTRDIPALNTLPEFEPFEAICESDVPFILPTTSDDGITGTWDIPEVDPIGLGGTEVMVTFTPDPGQCAERTFNSTVEILSGEPSTFDPIDAICESADPITLPTMSNNGFTGSWDVGATFDPSGLGGTTATISFTPDNADCGSGSQLQIEVLEPEVPIFDSFAPICETATPLTLTTTSSNGISGTWDVGADFNPMGQGGSTATLTFIPENMGCAAETDVTIEVQEALIPSFDLIGPVCFNASPLTLPEQSNEGVDGSWDVGTEFDPVGLSGEQSVTFNPSMDECAVQSTQIITVGNIDVPTINGKPCSSDLTSYSVDLTTTGDRVNSSEGNVTDNGNGSFIITDIPANMEVMVTIFDDAFGCDRVIPVSAPNCNCPNVDTPTGSDVSICQGDALATLSVVVSDNSFSANWYDAPAGGNLLMMESLSFDPVTPGIYYAETLDPQNGCVSNNRIEVELVVIPLDTTFAMDMTCDPNEVGVVPEIFSTSTCDSVVLTEFVLMEMDTTYVEAMTCDPMMVGMSSVNIPTSGCDSVVITETVLVLGDTTMQTGFTCDPLLVGSFDTLFESNSFGCDSLIITQFEMSEADTFRVTGTSCDPMASFLDTMIYPTAQCDSVVITLTTILMDSEELNTMSTCDPEEAGRDTVYLTNAAGCDSLIINEFILEDGISEAVVNVEQPMCNESTGSLSISNIVGGEMPYMYSIDDGATFSDNSTFENLSPGQYSVVIQDVFGCEFRVAEELFDGGGLSVFFTNTEEQLTFGGTLPLNPIIEGGSGALDITWTPAEFLSCNNCQYPLASPSESMSYSIRVMDEVGCVDSAEVFVRIVQGDLTFTPQAFSPNGDNINDHFTIFAAPGYVQSISYLRVYDRWGVKVFDKQNFPPNIDTEGWDGRMGNDDSISGVYVFVGELILHDGTSLPLKGEMTLVR